MLKRQCCIINHLASFHTLPSIPITSNKSKDKHRRILNLAFDILATNIFVFLYIYTGFSLLSISLLIPLAVIVAPLIKFLAETHEVNFYLFSLIIHVYNIDFIQIFVSLSSLSHSTNISSAHLIGIIHKPFRCTRHSFRPVRHV